MHKGLFLHVSTHSQNNINEVLTFIQEMGQNKNRQIGKKKIVQNFHVIDNRIYHLTSL
jgi:hypothetical protein